MSNDAMIKILSLFILLFTIIGLIDIVTRLYKAFMPTSNGSPKPKNSHEAQRIVIGEDLRPAMNRRENDTQHYWAPAAMAATAGAAYTSLHSDSDFALSSDVASGSGLDLHVVDDLSDASTHHDFPDPALGVNPANGLPMMTESMDIEGNLYGTDFSHDVAAHDMTVSDLTMSSDFNNDWNSDNDGDSTSDWSSGNDWDSYSSSDTHDWS